jgi:hypothetical protein
MPTMPEAKEPPPSRADRVAEAARRVGSVVGTDARVTARVMVFLAIAALGASMAPVPWSQIAVLALIGLALDWARRR